MSHIHVRRWHALEEDAELVFGPMSGSVADLTLYEEPEDDGLVMPDGTPIPRPEPPRKRMGFLPPDACGE